VLNTRSVRTTANLDPGRHLCRGHDDDAHDHEEARLLERAKELDPVALAMIYGRYAPRIHKYIYRQLGGKGTLSEQMSAEDLTAEVFLRMLKAIREDKAWKTSFSGWLYRIAHNLTVDHFRQRSRTPRVSLEDAPPLSASYGDPVQISENGLTQEQLWLAMQRLTGDQARVMTLRFLEGLSISEVASIMNRSEGAVKGLQYRAAVALRRLLASPPDRELCDEVPTRAVGDEYSPWRRRTMLPARA